jgi:fatty acid desaturase
MRESTMWRWSHIRHHNDTINVGGDPEISVPRPPQILKFICSFFGLTVIPGYFHRILIQSAGKLFLELAAAAI